MKKPWLNINSTGIPAMKLNFMGHLLHLCYALYRQSHSSLPMNRLRNVINRSCEYALAHLHLHLHYVRTEPTFTKPDLNTSKLSDEYTIAASILPGSELPFRIPLIPFVVRRGDQSTKFARNFSN